MTTSQDLGPDLVPAAAAQPIFQPALFDPMGQTSLADLEAIRLLLGGGSVIDWHRLAFHDQKEADRFLLVNEFDPQDGEDIERLENLRAEAVEYLTRHFGYRIPDEVASDAPATDLLMIASRRGKYQTYACMVLKLMHVMHHLNGRENLFRLPVSDDQLFGLVENKVVQVVDEIRAAGYPIVEFAWSRKERDSLITKLLAKRDSIAAHVYDKLRFRLVAQRHEDLAAVLRELLHKLIPFNYIIPGQTVNKILPFRQLVEGSDSLRRYVDDLQTDIDTENGEQKDNEFSSAGFRVVNFVADLPVRLSSVFRHINGTLKTDLSPREVIFVLAEFQVLDADSARLNETGENSHESYKERQHILVKSRLTRGMRNKGAKQEK
jgi:uncharacterized protein (TIGR04552 family)